jgi:hypothetical protein
VDYERLWAWTQSTYPVAVYEVDARLLIGAISTPGDEETYRRNLTACTKTRQWRERGAVPAYSRFMSERRWKTAPKEPATTDPLTARMEAV